MGQQDGQLAGDPGPSRPIYQDFKANLWDSTSEFGGDLSAVLVNIDSRCHADCCYLDVLQAPNQPFLAFWDATVLLLLASRLSCSCSESKRKRKSMSMSKTAATADGSWKSRTSEMKVS